MAAGSSGAEKVTNSGGKEGEGRSILNCCSCLLSEHMLKPLSFHRNHFTGQCLNDVHNTLVK